MSTLRRATLVSCEMITWAGTQRKQIQMFFFLNVQFGALVFDSLKRYQEFWQVYTLVYLQSSSISSLFVTPHLKFSGKFPNRNSASAWYRAPKNRSAKSRRIIPIVESSPHNTIRELQNTLYIRRQDYLVTRQTYCLTRV